MLLVCAKLVWTQMLCRRVSSHTHRKLYSSRDLHLACSAQVSRGSLEAGRQALTCPRRQRLQKGQW